MSKHQSRVVIVERRLTHYRVPLYELLRPLLAGRGIDFSLLVGSPTRAEAEKQDGGYLAWAASIPTRYWAAGAVCWQPFGKHLWDVDLVVVNHQNRLLYNHWLLCTSRDWRMAFWGHGRTMQTEAPNGLRERFKRWTISRVDWYFAYTQVSVDAVAETGFPRRRITNLNNTIDTSAACRDRDSLSRRDVAALKESLGLVGKPVGVFIGSLYAHKRLDFLLEACVRVRRRLPGFQCLLIGDGVERSKVREWTAGHDWVKWVGVRHGREKALYLACADVMLNPGLVGLGILDSFVFGVPMVTTDCGIHSPEIAYLRHGENGLMTVDDVDHFASAVTSLLGDSAVLQRMRQACIDSGAAHSIESMAARFADGIGAAIATPRLR